MRISLWLIDKQRFRRHSLMGEDAIQES